MQVFGTDYPTPDGTCIRDYIHISDLVAAHSDALAYLRQGASATLGRGFSVLEVTETVKGVSEFQGRASCSATGDRRRLRPHPFGAAAADSRLADWASKSHWPGRTVRGELQPTPA